MIGAIASILTAATTIGDKLIVDQDKKIEFAFKTLELAQRSMEVLLNTKTYPWVDGIVKLLYAIKELIVPMFRPVGSFAMAAFAAYCDIKEIPLSDTVSTILYGAPVAWGTSRHMEKSRKPK